MFGEYLAHYGVIGQKWGIRRYQNKDGGLTALGKKHYSSEEIAADNKAAFEKGKKATLAGSTMKYAEKLNERNRRKLENATSENEAQRRQNYERSSKAADKATKEYEAVLKDAMAHAQSLIDKYGKENVKDIAYKTLPDGRQVVNEKVYTGKQKATGVLTFMVAAFLPGTAWLFPLVPMPVGVKGAFNAAKIYKNTR